MPHTNHPLIQILPILVKQGAQKTTIFVGLVKVRNHNPIVLDQAVGKSLFGAKGRLYFEMTQGVGT